MPQSLTQLPKKMEFAIAGWDITIRDHVVVKANHLFGVIIDIASDTRVSRGIFTEFEKHGISFEMVIEECARELEHDANVLAEIIRWEYLALKKIMLDGKRMNLIRVFSNGVAGRKIAAQYIKKIRSCNDWEELYDTLKIPNEFHKRMRRKVIREIRQQ